MAKISKHEDQLVLFTEADCQVEETSSDRTKSFLSNDVEERIKHLFYFVDSCKRRAGTKKYLLEFQNIDRFEQYETTYWVDGKRFKAKLFHRPDNTYFVFDSDFFNSCKPTDILGYYEIVPTDINKISSKAADKILYNHITLNYLNGQLILMVKNHNGSAQSQIDRTRFTYPTNHDSHSTMLTVAKSLANERNFRLVTLGDISKASALVEELFYMYS